MRCDTPHKEKKFTMKFVQVNPSPFGFEFDEGDYFLICKSENLNNFMISKIFEFHFWAF